MELKGLRVTNEQLKTAGRWDIDYHLPPLGIESFPRDMLTPTKEVADIVRVTTDPTKTPNVAFLYVDIASIDVETGTIITPQELTGEEAPSRARQIIQAYDVIVSTCRPTRGAIAVVPESLHGQICSTGFSVLRAKTNVNPFYIHYALRLPSTLEQFRKWSTGSSYPAILDEDINKTLIPLPKSDIQDMISKQILIAKAERAQIIKAVNKEWERVLNNIFDALSQRKPISQAKTNDQIVYSTDQIRERLGQLPPITNNQVKETSKDRQILEFT